MKLLPGIIVGALAGVAAGILMAPESGESTRKKLSKDGTKLKSELERSLNDGIVSFLDSVSNAIDEYAKEGQKAAKRAKRKQKKGVFGF